MRGRVHGDVEGVTSDDLMQMRGVCLSRIDDRVDTVDDQLGACETQHVLSRALLSEERHERESRPLHFVLT